MCPNYPFMDLSVRTLYMLPPAGTSCCGFSTESVHFLQRNLKELALKLTGKYAQN